MQITLKQTKEEFFVTHIGSKQLSKLTDGPEGGVYVDWIEDVALDATPNGKLSIQWGQLKRSN